MKKLLSILIAIALMLSLSVTAFAAETTYELWVGGVQVTDANKDDIVKAINDAANATVATGTATYDPVNNILTLDNFSYTGEGYNYSQRLTASIFFKDPLTIKLVGNNTVTNTQYYGICCEDEDGNLLITDDSTDSSTGSLTVNGADCGIFLFSDLRIENAKVTASGILCKNITIEDSYVNSTGEYYGISSLGEISITASTVEASGTDGAVVDNWGNGCAPNFTGDFDVYAGDDASAGKVDAPTDATYANKYVKIAPAEPEAETKSTTVTYQVDPTFTVTIPATVALGEAATIKAENVMVPKGKQVEVALTNANGFAVATPQGAELGYTVKNGEATVNEGDTVLAVNPDNGKTGETTLTFTTPETVKFAGDYTGTVTFTIAVNPAVNN